jgi:hypothetical protein
MSASESSSGAASSGLPDTSVLLSFALGVFFAGAAAVAVRFTVAELAPFVTVSLGALLVLAAVFVGALSGGTDKQAGVEEPAAESR